MGQPSRRTKTPIAKRIGEAERKPVQKWQLQTAKAQFSEVFRRAMSEGPQHVTKQGKEEVVIISKEQFEALSRRENEPANFGDFLMNSPLAGSGIQIERRRDYPRKIQL